MKKLSLINKIANFYILLTLVGFVFIATIPKFIKITESSLTVPFGIFIDAISLILIFNALLSKRLTKFFLKKFTYFIFFWAFYIARVFHDIYINPINFYEDRDGFYYLQFALGYVFIPSVAIMIVTQAYKINYAWMLKSFYISLLCILIAIIYNRVSSGIEGRDVGNIYIDVLYVGHYGVTLILLSVFLLVNSSHNLRTILLIGGILIGIIAIIVSASKSTLVAFPLVVGIFIYLWYKNVKGIILISFIGLLIYLFSSDLYSFINIYIKSNLYERIQSLLEIGGDTARISLMQTAINEFIQKPLFGSAMLIQKSKGAYPHNLIIEAFMATGIIGGIFFIKWILKCIKGTLSLIENKHSITWIGLVFLQYLIFGMFSGSLYDSNMFWFFSVLLVGGINSKSLYSTPQKLGH